MRALAVILLGLGLSGCAERWAAQDDSLCQSYGASPGSSAYMQCRMAQDQRRDQRFRDIGQALDGMKVQNPTPPAYPPPATYSCQTTFGTTTCRPQ